MAVTIVLQKDLPAKLRQPAFAKQFSAGMSPGAVGAELGITRQATHDLIRRGRLDAIRIVTDAKPHRLLALIVPESSLQLYRLTRQHHRKRA